MDTEDETNYDIEEVAPNEIPEVYKPPDSIPQIMSRTYVIYPYLKEFKDEDFDTSSKTFINFVTKDTDGDPQNEGYWFVLFNDESAASRKYLKVWVELARIIRDDRCYLGHCNLTFEKKINNAFQKLGKKDNMNNPFAWAKYLEVPFIMVYRDGWPQGFYNGSLYIEELIDYCTDIVPNNSMEISKQHLRRKDIREEILERDHTILKELALERRREREEREREEEKKINTSEQKVSRSVDFFS